MTARTSALVVALLLLPVRGAAQEVDARVLAAAAGIAVLVLLDDEVQAVAPWPAGGRAGADWASTGVVAAALVLPCLDDRTSRCVGVSALRAGLSVGITEATKRLVPRERPDRSDRKSFFSGHTALACVGGMASARQAIGSLLCAGAGYLRLAADRHWLTDVLVGAGVGFGLSRIAR